jgi:hypothetical protein
VYKTDNSLGMENRSLCGRCDGHLGHLWWWTCAYWQKMHEFYRTWLYTRYQIKWNTTYIENNFLTATTSFGMFCTKPANKQSIWNHYIGRLAIGVLRPFMKI